MLRDLEIWQKFEFPMHEAKCSLHILHFYTSLALVLISFLCMSRLHEAHRARLAASSDYFRGMFTSSMKESRQESVSLLLVGAAKFEALLHYTYSGALALGWGCVFDLTCTSLQLQFQTAFSLCLNFLQQEIDAYSCLGVASFAEAYGMADLLALADDFVLRHFQDVSITPKFQDLPVEKLKKYLQSDSLCVPSELPVFKAVMCCIKAFPRKRVKLARELMGTIQFPLMTFKEFKEVKSITSFQTLNQTLTLNFNLFTDLCQIRHHIFVQMKAML
uniref:BTB domain-containing protein n=1 Tax=Sinocyclocheilus anshuiensis TaxID=1608454 RepID=A0A671QTH1_9TELE